MRTILGVPVAIGMIFSSKLRSFIVKRIFQKIPWNILEDTVWVHCASVGEVNLAEPIIEKFIEKTENIILITMLTDTGRSTAEKKYSNNPRIKLLFFPLDDYYSIKRILKRINLKKLILVETEIWPNLIKLGSENAKVVMINGRISDSSIRSYSKIRKILKNLFTKIDIFIMQTERDRKRIVFLGAPKEKTYNYGNLKFNIELPKYKEEELKELRSKLEVGDKKVFVAGSTRTGEEEFILEAFKELENTLLILVPRHIERTSDICERLLDNKFKYQKWSEIEKIRSKQLIVNTKEYNTKARKEEKEVIIIDKIGELRKLYAICDIAYVGGTLVDVGGHSLLEPLFYRKSPLFGPYVQNVRDIAREVLARKIGTQVNDLAGLKNALLEIKDKNNLKNSNEKKSLEDGIEKFFDENGHVVELTFNKIKN